MSGRIEISLQQLRSMIGVRVACEGKNYTVVEVLEDGPAIVLLEDQSLQSIQPNLHGTASRRVCATTLTIPILTPDHQQIHPDYLNLELLDD